MYPAHLLSSVDVHALVEMLLQVGHHGVVPRHPVDTDVLQTRRLHHATAHLHYQRDKLWERGREGNRKRDVRAVKQMVGAKWRDEAKKQ